MMLLTLVVLIGGAFAIAFIASEAHFGHPRRKNRKDKTDGQP
jgi:hypothetical protein